MLTLDVDKWLYTQLASISGVNGVYEGVAPQTASFPIIVFSTLDGRPIYEVGTREIMQSFEISIQAITVGSSYTPLEGIVEAIATKIHRASGQGSGYVISASRKGVVIKNIKVLDGVSYYHLGNVYSIYAQKI